MAAPAIPWWYRMRDAMLIETIESRSGITADLSCLVGRLDQHTKRPPIQLASFLLERLMRSGPGGVMVREGGFERVGREHCRVLARLGIGGLP
jgi:hypothetical protein